MITNEQKQKIENFTEHHKEMTLELLKQLTAIPAPSHYEEKKAATSKAAPKKEESAQIKNQAAATTLGDIDALAELKAKMEKGE